MRTLLIGPRGHGGEGVYMASLQEQPPAGIQYDVSGDFHESAVGASCSLALEVALNQVLHRAAIPDMGFRALRLLDRYDLVHVHAHPIVLRHLGDTPLVMSEGSSSAVYLGDYLGWDPPRLKRGYRRARRLYRLLGIHDRLLRMDRAAKVYVFSSWARDVNLRWGADPAKLEVIYPGFDSPPSPSRTDHEAFTFLFVGSDFERKGGFELVEAFAKLAGDLPSIRLVLAGSDPAQPNPDRFVHSWVAPGRRLDVLETLAALTRAGRIEQHRWISHERLRTEVFPSANVFVMPTHAEGFGFTNVEAMSFGLPVITTDVGPATEIVTPNTSGLLVRPGDVEGLAEAMASLATAPERARRLGEAGHGIFLDRFTRERFRSRLGDLYARAVAT